MQPRGILSRRAVCLVSVMLMAVAAVPPAEPAEEAGAPDPETSIAANTGSTEITLREIRIEGNHLITTEELLSAVVQFIGKPVSSADLEKIRLLLTAYYIDRGYINSGALLPDQAVRNGVVSYRIVEGRLNDVVIAGSELLREGFLDSRIRRNNRQALNIEMLRNNLIALRGNPNVQYLHAELVPGATFGLADLRVDIVDATRHQLDVTLDNYSPASVGEEQLGLHYGNTSLFRGSETLDIVFRKTEGLREYSANYAVPFTANDTTVFFGVDRSEADIVEEPFDVLNIFSETRAANLGINLPLVRGIEDVSSLTFSVDRQLSKTALFDQPFSFSAGFVDGQARVTAARISHSWRHSKPDYTLAVQTRFSRGLDALDSSINENLPDSDFTSLTNQIIFLKRFDNSRLEFLVRNDIQWSSEPLLSMEQFSLGGINSVRGYRENRIISDRGLFASAEVRFRATNEFRFGAFLDYGAAENKNRELPGTDKLYSAGVSVNWLIGGHVFFELIWAEALQDVVEDSDSLQAEGIHLSFSSTVNF